MKRFESKLFSIIAFFLLTTAAAFGANTFEGCSLIVPADDTRACPVQYRPGGNNVTPNGDGQWCFTGATIITTLSSIRA